MATERFPRKAAKRFRRTARAEHALSARCAVHADAVAEAPAARAGPLFDEQIVANAQPFLVAYRIFVIDALGTVGTLYPVPYPAHTKCTGA